MSASLILSDSLAALLTVAILLALMRETDRSAAIAGGLAGALVCVRLLGLVALPSALIAVRGSRRRAIVAICAAPFLAGLALYQWRTFGSPLDTGYDYWLPRLHLRLHTFSVSYLFGNTFAAEGPFVYPDRLNGGILQGVCPCPIGGPMRKLVNVAFYPSVAVGLFWVFAPPLTGLTGLVKMVIDRRSVAARFSLLTVVLNLGLVSFYFFRAARFIAPAASLLIVYGALCISGLMTRLWGHGTEAMRRLASV